jgi:hypothetical protein
MAAGKAGYDVHFNSRGWVGDMSDNGLNRLIARMRPLRQSPLAGDRTIMQESGKGWTIRFCLPLFTQTDEANALVQVDHCRDGRWIWPRLRFVP